MNYPVEPAAKQKRSHGDVRGVLSDSGLIMMRLHHRFAEDICVYDFLPVAKSIFLSLRSLFCPSLYAS